MALLLLPPSPNPPTSATTAAISSSSSYRRATLLRHLDSISSLSEVRQYHSLLIRLGLSSDNHAAARLLKFLAISPSGDLPYALRLFHRLPSPDPFLFNTLFRSPLFPPLSSFLLFSRMLSDSLLPNRFSFPSLLRCVSSEPGLLLPFGLQLHALLFKLGFASDPFSRNSLLLMYLSCALPDAAHRVFDSSADLDVVSWTTMITGLSKLGLVDDARELFDAMPERNSVSWNAMIAGYVQDGRFADAFELFDRMREEGIGIDKFVAASMLSACTGVGALERGRWIHEHIETNGIELDGKLATTVIDMYCKCGCLDKAYEVFVGLPQKGLSSWNCMIGGFAVHGRGEKAIELFHQMEKEGVMPDDITLLNVLSACAHSGLVAEGRHYFEHIVETYNIEPKMEHFGCMVDLLGRAGLLEEAKKVIDNMPMEADAGVLGALLGACRIHGNLGIGEKFGRRVIELDSRNSGRYVLMANMFASAGRWEDVADMRRLMNDRGVNKEAGRSVIEMNGLVHEFICGGRSHPEAREIYAKVDEILKRIRLEGYIPDTGGVLHDIDEEEEKENPLYHHSEKLAIAYGLLHAKAGETIRITKNLRVCRDCHEASKLISGVFGHEIIVRDRNRFHHFEGGECSCKDYW